MSEEEKAKLEELYENSEWWHNRFKAVQRDYENLQQKINKAIEYIRSNEWAKDYEISNCRTHLLEILGDKENE